MPRYRTSKPKFENIPKHLHSSKHDEDLLLLEQLLMEEMYEQSEKSLYKFFLNFWKTFDPQPLVNNWHLECMCEHIQAAAKRQIRRLIINVSPRSSKCLNENTLIRMADGSQKPIKDILPGEYVLSLDTEKGIHKPGKVTDVINSGLKPVYKVVVDTGETIYSTKEHRFYTWDGYKRLEELSVGDDVSVARSFETLLKVAKEESLKKIVSIEYVGYENTYDICVPEYENFTTAEGFHVHNSTTSSITFPVWQWLHHPEEKFWLISHSARLFMQNVMYARKIMEHPQYQNRWMNPELEEHFRFTLAKDSNTKSRIDNTCGGYINTGSPTGKVLGMGYTVAVLDDLLDSEESHNPVAVQGVNDWFTNTFLNRSNDVNNDVIIIPMQRLATDDITGYVQRMYPEQDWFVLNLPAKYDPDRTFVSPIGYNDKRTVRNQLIDPVRLPEEFLIAQSKKPLIYNTRYLQNPEATGDGNFIKSEWIRESDSRPINHSVMITVWDLSITETAESDYTVGLVMCKFGDEFHIIDMWRKQCEIPEQIDAIRKMKRKYPQSIVGVEARSNGHAAMGMLRREIQNIYAFEPAKFGGSKEQRLGAVLQYFRDKKVCIYNPFQPDSKLEPTYSADTIIKELKAFPLGNDDIVDCVAYGINYLAEYGQENTAMVTKGSKIVIAEEDYVLERQLRSAPGIYDYTDYTLDSHLIPTRSDLADIQW